MPGEDAPSYDVALSYAGEDRPIARRLAEVLRHRGVSVFTDEDKAALWGEDLYDFLSDLYHRRARYCVMFVSASYAKQWTRLERRAAQARALNESGYILPVRLDQTEMPGLLPTVGFLCWPPENEQTIADAVVQKLSGRGALGAVVPAAAPGLVVDDVIVETEADHLVLDVRIRNAGHEVVNVTRADLHVLSRDELLSSYAPSATYELMLKDEHNVIRVGHVLQPGEVDAFLIEVGYTSNCRGTAEVILQYNGDRKTASQPFPFHTWR